MVRDTIRILALLVPLSAAADLDALHRQFQQPPAHARPQTWWHWTNGYIDPVEARRDLEWMHDVGLGGVQVFEAGLGAETPPDRRLVYGSDAWRQAFRESVAAARELGLDFAITTSPGWSATGGPWVEPADAMKKVVWSSTVIAGGRRVEQQLERPPATTGPYLDLREGGDAHGMPERYGDIAVLAVPYDAAALPALTFSASEPVDDLSLLDDGRFAAAFELAADAGGEAFVLASAAAPFTVRAVTVGLPGRRGFGSPAPPVAELQASNDGRTYRPVARMPGTKSLVRSASFEPVTARHFRLRLFPSDEPSFLDTLRYAEGAIRLGMPSRASRYAVSEFRLHTAARINRVEEKAGYAPATDYYALATPAALGAASTVDKVVDLTDRVDADGNLAWDAPAGAWQVYRFGWSLTGEQNGPAPAEATGLEVDKLSAARVDAYLDAYLAHYRDETGRLPEGLTGLLSDSIESGSQNWTESMRGDFIDDHGYDPLPWLPVLTGELLGGPEQSDRFLWDYRDTISRSLTDAHYRTIAAAAKRLGLTYYAEALEDHRPQLGNDLDIRSVADVPMAAFWYYPAGTSPKATYLMDVKGAASVAHIYGREIVAAESMTTFGFPWAVGPAELKVAADRAMVTGVNRLILHSSVHQAVGRNFTPGQSMRTLLGQYFNRNSTWSELARPWIDYLARSQYLLQQGVFDASFVYFIGEEAPVTGLFGDRLPGGIPPGYDYDFVAVDGLDRLRVENGRLVADSGTSYDFLFLGGASERMTVRALEKLAGLAETGATIAGRRPVASPSLADSDQAFTARVGSLWARGNVIEADLPIDAIGRLGIAPQWQFRVTGANADSAHGLAVQKRRIDDAILFFIVNTRPEPVSGRFITAGDGSVPSLWRATTGDRHTPADWRERNGELQVALGLAPHEAVFLVFGDKPASTARSEMAASVAVPLEQPWVVEFDPRFGAIPAVTSAQPFMLDEHEVTSVRHYSGLSTWRSTFHLARASQGQPIELTASRVADIAHVYVNGALAGALWTPPYRLDISPFARTGENELAIVLANVWANRLIGMAREQQSVGGFPSDAYTAQAPLRPAGLADIRISVPASPDHN